MKGFVRISKKILVGGVLILFMGYTESSTLFLHSHFIHGKQIVHSHPYSDSPDSGKHTHTPSQFTLIAGLSSLWMLAASPGYSFRVFTSVSFIQAKAINNYATAQKIAGPSLRGPPVC